MNIVICDIRVKGLSSSTHLEIRRHFNYVASITACVSELFFNTYHDVTNECVICVLESTYLEMEPFDVVLIATSTHDT